jgi:NADPH-dependent 2,4-dienoyl-CoA reductase/sulfur reductase-like enzyme
MAQHFTYIIIGGGLTGASAIEGIRQRDTSGTIALFANEARIPYDRPPLTKGLWSGKNSLEDLPVYKEDFYASHNVRLFLGQDVTKLDPGRKEVTVGNGTPYTYDRVLLATGGAPRKLTYGEGVLRYYRRVDDYLALAKDAGSREDFLIVGGGFIGAELAAALRMKNRNVTVLFPERYLLQRIFPADLARSVTEYYREKGVNILSGDVLVSATQSGERAVVKTREGRTISTDVAVIAIGLVLNTQLAEGAGLKVDNGIAVNEYLQSSNPDVYAAGDVTRFPSPVLEKTVHVEHWDNARAQGKYAGLNMAGAKMPYDYLPFFYSDLFDLGFEAVGELDSALGVFADWKTEFREGVVYYLEGGKVRGVLLWNVWERVDAAREIIASKKIVARTLDLKGRL